MIENDNTIENGNTAIPAEECEAYRRSIYDVYAPEGIIEFRIGQYCEALAHQCRSPMDFTAALITAFNPYGEPLPISENLTRNAVLRTAISKKGLEVWDTESHGRNGDWREKGFLAIGINRETAIMLGRQYQQNAIVWIEGNFIPDLIFLR